MRRIFTAMLCIILILAMTCPVYATTGNEVLLQIAEEHKEEQDGIKLAVENTYDSWTSYLGNDASSIDYHLMYQCYNLEEHDIVEAFKQNGEFGSNILDTYVWIVPNYGKGGEVEVVAIENSDYGWKIRSGQRLRKYKGISNIDIESFYDRILDEYPETDPESFKVIKCTDYNCRFIYFTCNDIEYLTPYFYSEDPDWAKSGEVYTAENIIAKITENYNMGVANDNNGVISFVKSNLDYILIGSAVLFAAVIVVGIIIKKNKRKKEDE